MIVAVIGHEAVRAELEENLPSVTLLLGPPSTGKDTLARYLAQYHHMTWAGYKKLTAALAREVVELVPRIPASGRMCIIIELDGATETAQNILLKVLEEPPEHTRFILTASLRPLNTVVSRSQVHRLSYLTAEQVQDILVSVCGASLEKASRAAAGSRGQVAPALSAIAADEDTRIRSVVAAAVKAARDGGGATLELALRSWSPWHAMALREWAQEASGGRWSRFSAEFAPGVTRAEARNVLQVLSQYEGSRNAAAVALARAFNEEK